MGENVIAKQSSSFCFLQVLFPKVISIKIPPFWVKMLVYRVIDGQHMDLLKQFIFTEVIHFFSQLLHDTKYCKGQCLSSSLALQDFLGLQKSFSIHWLCVPRKFLFMLEIII